MYEWRRVCSTTPLRVDEDHRDLGGRRARDHVARVLDVAGRVGKLEPAPRRDERAVRDVDRDPLLALGAEAVGEQREVDVAVAAALARLLDVLHLVDEDLLRVVEQPADERRLAVVHRAVQELRLHEAQERGRRGCDGGAQGAGCTRTEELPQLRLAQK